jgi:hypothetical protein
MELRRVEPGLPAPLPSSLVTSTEGATDGALTWFGQEREADSPRRRGTAAA